MLDFSFTLVMLDMLGLLLAIDSSANNKAGRAGIVDGVDGRSACFAKILRVCVGEEGTNDDVDVAMATTTTTVTAAALISL